MKSSPLVILTNDDGLHADGLQILRRTLIARGYRTVTVAPDRGASGASRGLTLSKPLILRPAGADQYMLDGTPTDCVMMALFEVVRGKWPPAVILSGINHGQNLGDDVTYSGTCAGAAEGCMEGIPSVALSAVPSETGDYDFEGHADYFVTSIFPKIFRLRIPRYSFLNVNFPPRPASRVRGVRVVPMGRSTYFDPIVRQRHPDPYRRKDRRWVYWIAGAPKALKKKGTDIEAVEKGFVSISPVRIELDDPKLLRKCRAAFNGR